MPRLSSHGAGVALLLIPLAIVGCGSTTTTVSTASGSAGANGGNVSVNVTSPTGGAVIAASSVTVRGTVDPPNATVQVQGRAAAVGNGVFTGTAELHGGKTTIDVIGSAAGDSPGSTSVEVTRQSSGGSSGGSSSRSSGGSSAGGSAATPNVAHASPGETSGGQTPCGSGLSVGPDTTCDFAENVRSTYESEGPGTHDVYSPVTKKTYSMTCSAGTPVVCTGGNNASVYFP
jgi:hypothetical protein